MSLLIVESPAKCCLIEHYLAVALPLSEKVKCIACCGHFMEIAGLAAIPTKTYEPTFTLMSNKKTIVKSLLEEVKKAQEQHWDILLATDDDREGEAIAWHLCVLLNLPLASTKRMRFHELTAASLQKAVVSCDRINMPLVHAQQARQVLDILVGFKVSPMLWHHLKQPKLSAGRCQTPALRLIYDNHVQGLQQEQQCHYAIIGYFTSLNLPFRLSCKTNENLNYKNKHEVEAFLQASIKHRHVFTGLHNKQFNKPTPLPFNTSALLQTARTKPSETLTLCQSLYEKGYITYIRTDSTTFCTDFQQRLSSFLAKEYNSGAKEYNSGAKEYNSGAKEYNSGPKPNQTYTLDSTNAHEAIRPTDLNTKELISASKKEQELYTLIRNRTLESGLPPAVLKSWCASITAPFGHAYHYTCTSVVFSGWLQIQPKVQEEDNAANATFLQNLKPDTEVYSKKITAKTELVGRHAHLTEAELIHQLEEQKIGRPSTFVSLVEKIKDRQYVTRTSIDGVVLKCTEYSLEKGVLQEQLVERILGAEKNKLVLTPLGLQTITFLLQYFEPLFAYTYTRTMETLLDNPVLAKEEKMKLCQDCDTVIETLAAAVVGTRGKETIYIDQQHSYVTGRYGPVIKKGISPECAVTDEQKTSFLAITGDLDMDKLRRGEYTVSEIALPAGQKEHACLGEYLGEAVWLKSGKFGRYLDVGEDKKSRRISLKGHASNHIPMYKVTLADVRERLVQQQQQDAVFTRSITADATLRNGPHGDYIYYKNSKMKRPKFLELGASAPADPRTCDIVVLQQWFHDKYKV